MEKNHKNPNSWSELPQDLVISVFERLGFADFSGAKSVCSSWHSASRQSVPTNQVPWLILFPLSYEDTSFTIFNPEENDKLYKTQALGVEFAKSSCKATYGSWLLMQDIQWNLCIVNLFTHKRINLPPMESQLGVTKVERDATDRVVIFDQVSSRYRGFYIVSPVLWIDEKTKEYIVLYALGKSCVVYCKKGDNFWNQVPQLTDCDCMLYKDHKLYFISESHIFIIIDFSGQIPQQTFQCSMLPTTLSGPWYVFWKRFVVTVRGDVLMVENVVSTLAYIESFRIFKIYSSSSGFLRKYERVESLGDETMVLDLGITVLANKVEGLHRNSIYFSDCCCFGDYFIFNLETQKMEGFDIFDFGSLCGHWPKWFIPSFTHT